MSLRKLVGKFTSPIFIPLRKFIIWGDTRFGTCDMKLTLESRWENPLNGFADMDEETKEISKLMGTVSKERMNRKSAEYNTQKSIGNSFPPQQVIDHLRKYQQEEE